MTVCELIAALKRLDGDAEVYLELEDAPEQVPLGGVTDEDDVVVLCETDPDADADEEDDGDDE